MKPSRPPVHVVIPNWNGWPDTLECLGALRDLRSTPVRPVVVDNGSTDDSVARIRTAFPDCELIALDRNLGFAGGSNVGIRHALQAGAGYVWLLNNDATPEPGALGAMLEAARSDDVGLVGSVLRYAHDPEEVQALGGGYVSWWLGLPHNIVRSRDLARLEYLLGASMLVRSEVFEKVGLLDEGFFLYWEDVDFCVRARTAGWELAVATEAVVLHKEGGTAGSGGARRSAVSADVHHLRSLTRFMKKHRRLWPIPVLVRGLLEIPNQLRYGTPGRLAPIWRTLLTAARSPLRTDR